VLFGLFFMFSNFYQLDLHNKTCVVLVIHNEASSKIISDNQTSHDLVMVIISACLLILLTKYINPPKYMSCVPIIDLGGGG
jgi:hypothetical protein